ncbi:hypothetical protein L873DRAFT_1817257, partial [Choiromyces venosus 120613-1]
MTHFHQIFRTRAYARGCSSRVLVLLQDLHTVKPMKYIALVIRQLYHEDNEALLDNTCQFTV